MTISMTSANTTWLIYDGECPFCSRYAQWAEIKRRVPEMELLDARANRDHSAVQKVRGAGLELDEGMAMVFADGRILHGSDVIAALAAQGSVLSGQNTAAKVYPWLRWGRNTTLKLLGRKKLGF